MPRFLASLAAVGLIASTGAQAVEISISCSALGKEYEICKQGVDAWAQKTGNTVKIVSTPNSASDLANGMRSSLSLTEISARRIGMSEASGIWHWALAPPAYAQCQVPNAQRPGPS